MKQELLAPAGDPEAGYAALYYGADAVYLGLKNFSARAGAQNFTASELDELTAYAHSLGRKVYVAINTVIQEHELKTLIEQLDICAKCQVDAVILQDLGVARIIRESYPSIELHASTQMAVHNKEGALFLQKQGFSRVVLARELTKSEIAEIAAIDGLETEAFIHGALCYSYSGLCQFSAMETGRSANRGKCAYPCRACFKTAEGNRHVFSMKDMALQENVLKMPVTSLKIEGRKKSALYVAAVTDYYRRILDGKGNDINRAENIRQIFSRPWCQFHFNGKNKNVIDPEFVGHRGLPIGRIEKVGKSRIFLTLQHNLGRFDGLQIDVPGYGKPLGFSVQNIRVNSRGVFKAAAGESAEIEVPSNLFGLKKGLNVYLSSSTEVKGAYPFIKPKPREFINGYPLDVSVEIKTDSVTAMFRQYVAVIDGNFSKAEQPQKAEEAIRTAFSKTGGTSFSLKTLHIKNDDGLFVPVSKLNELRRRLYEQIKPQYDHGSLPECGAAYVPETAKWLIKTDDLDNLSALDLENFAEIIYLIKPETKPKDLAKLPKNKIRLALPAVCRRPAVFFDAVHGLLDAGYKKWEASNYWALEVLPIERIDLSFDSSLYMFNSQAICEAQSLGASRITLAIEDTSENMAQILQKAVLPTVAVVYQDVPLFTSAACIRDNDCAHCDRSKKWQTLEKDGNTYQALSENCQIMLFKAQPYCVAAELKKLPVAFRRIDFCYKKYTPNRVAEIVKQLFSHKNIKDACGGNINSPKI